MHLRSSREYLAVGTVSPSLAQNLPLGGHKEAWPHPQVGRSGSSTDLTAPKSIFRSSPGSELESDIGPCPRRATTGLEYSPGSDVP